MKKDITIDQVKASRRILEAGIVALICNHFNITGDKVKKQPSDLTAGEFNMREC